MRLEDLKPSVRVTGIVRGESVIVLAAQWHGQDVVELTYKCNDGTPRSEILYRDREAELGPAVEDAIWSFDGESDLFKLVSEARRIKLAHAFDPLLAVHISQVEPLPHQITAVYEAMLPRLPLRYLLADDPGAGKTIMAGLLIKELMLRGDLRRCLICAPGNLVEQWQDELFQKFQLEFEILSRDRFENSRTGNPFTEIDLAIVRLDMMSRNENDQSKLIAASEASEWDLIVCDEAHKMSATYFGNEFKSTKRYRLGQLLGTLTHHFLLMTATPHNGKEVDFQLFMALIDPDRFEGKFREGVHSTDTSDMMRRIVKEQMLKFDGTPLFPERFAYTVNYQLSDGERAMYERVTTYVKDEMNRVDKLIMEGDERRGNVVGFALTILQRRLASSPEAIYQSLKRRRERLQERLRKINRSRTRRAEELKLDEWKSSNKYLLTWNRVPGNGDVRLARALKEEVGLGWLDDARIDKKDDGGPIIISSSNDWIKIALGADKRTATLETSDGRTIDLTVKDENGELNIYYDKEPDEGIDEYVDEAPGDEQEKYEEEILDKATAARTVPELETEIETLRSLEAQAHELRKSGADRKWEELSSLLQHQEKMFDGRGNHEKLIIFSEHRDTVNYLATRIRRLLGREDALVVIHGGMHREARNAAKESFLQDKDVLILVATDAAGEGVNLQRAHLMVNYDLPWNPNRIEQRFGRIHRIKQTEVCHLWNLVASETREGEVYHRLLSKLEVENKALGGKVFNVLSSGGLFKDKSLKDLLKEAIRYGDRPDVRAKLNERVDMALARENILHLLENMALASESMDTALVHRVREELERQEAKKLQPHFIRSFFLEAFRWLGGSYKRKEPNRYELCRVPLDIRKHKTVSLARRAIPKSYERICFDKELASEKPCAEFVCPGHPLLDATIELLLEREGRLLKRGAIFIDPEDMGETPRILFFLEHEIQDARVGAPGRPRRPVSRRMQFVEISPDGSVRAAGYAPYLDYRTPTDEERNLAKTVLQGDWITGGLESRAVSYALEHLAKDHLAEVEACKKEYVQKRKFAVSDRLGKARDFWVMRAEELKADELAGKPNASLNSSKARQRADEFEKRLADKMADLDAETRLAPLLPLVTGRAAVLPQGLVKKLAGTLTAEDVRDARDRERLSRIAVRAVMDAERRLGRVPVEMPANNPGYDIESKIPGTGKLLFIEVKGVGEGAPVVTVHKTQILTALNKPDDFVLAIVQVEGERVKGPHYIRQPFQVEPDFGVESVNYKVKDLLKRSVAPS